MAFIEKSKIIDFRTRILFPEDLDGTEFYIGCSFSNGYTTFNTMSGSGAGTKYQIPNATNLRIIGGWFWSGVANANGTIGYADNSVNNVGVGSLTNPVYIAGNQGIGYNMFGAGISGQEPYYINWVIDAATTPGKYPFGHGTGSSSAWVLFCREETP